MAMSNKIIEAYMKDVVDGYYLLETEEGEYKLPVGIVDIEDGTIIRIEDKFLKLVLPDTEENTRNENIIDNNSNNVLNEKQIADWTDETTKLLIDLYKIKLKLVEERKLKTFKRMWEIIRDEVNKYGYNYTALQCQTKWRSLERAYKNKVDNNKKTGRGRKVCAFENELNDIFVKRNTGFPPCVMDAEMIMDRQDLMNERGIKHDLSISSPSPTSVENENTVDETIPICPPKSRKSKKSRNIHAEVKKLREVIEKRTEEKKVIDEKRYEQRERLISEMQRRNDILQNFLNRKD